MSDNQAPLSEPELAAAIDLLRQIIPDKELERLAPTGPAPVRKLNGSYPRKTIFRGRIRHSFNYSKDILDTFGALNRRFEQKNTERTEHR